MKLLLQVILCALYAMTAQAGGGAHEQLAKRIQTLATRSKPKMLIISARNMQQENHRFYNVAFRAYMEAQGFEVELVRVSSLTEIQEYLNAVAYDSIDVLYIDSHGNEGVLAFGNNVPEELWRYDTRVQPLPWIMRRNGAVIINACRSTLGPRVLAQGIANQLLSDTLIVGSPWSITGLRPGADGLRFVNARDEVAPMRAFCGAIALPEVGGEMPSLESDDALASILPVTQVSLPSATTTPGYCQRIARILVSSVVMTAAMMAMQYGMNLYSAGK